MQHSKNLDPNCMKYYTKYSTHLLLSNILIHYFMQFYNITHPHPHPLAYPLFLCQRQHVETYIQFKCYKYNCL